MKGRLFKSRKKGCPTCRAVDAKSCVRCYGKTRWCDWLLTAEGWKYMPIGSDIASARRKA